VERRHHTVDRGFICTGASLRLSGFLYLGWIVRAVVAELHLRRVRAYTVVRHVLELLLVVESLVLITSDLLLNRRKSQINIVIRRQTIIPVLKFTVDHQLQLGELLSLTARLPGLL